MKTKKVRFIKVLSTALLVIVLVLQVFPLEMASAAQITLRSLTLQAGATDGGSKPGGVVNHLFTYTLPSVGNTNVGSIKFMYCTLAAAPADACTTPTGLDTTSATLGSENGVTGFTMVNTTNGSPYLTKTAAAVSAGTIATHQLASVTNPTTTNQTFFVRIRTYASEDVTGASTDAGVVTASTATQIILEGIMPESLVFCAGETIGLTSTVPDCATATAGLIYFNQLFSPTDTATSTSQMAASTNAGSGYAISVNGPTLTSGSSTITGMAYGPSVKGIGQFGLNLKANSIAASVPAIGIEAAPVANATNFRGQAATNYDTVDNFKFNTGDIVANSYNGITPFGTDAQIFTVSYIANVPGSQPAGTYVTTLTYIATPTY